MKILSTLCFIIGGIIAIVFGIQLLILAFRTSILWGLGYLLIPLVSLIFVITHWEETKTPFLRCLLAIPFYLLGVFLMPGHS